MSRFESRLKRASSPSWDEPRHPIWERYEPEPRPMSGPQDSIHHQRPMSGPQDANRHQRPMPGPLDANRHQRPMLGLLDANRHQRPMPGPLDAYRHQRPMPGPQDTNRHQTPMSGPRDSDRHQTPMSGPRDSDRHQTPMSGPRDSDHHQTPTSGPRDPVQQQKRLDRLEQLLEQFIEKAAPAPAPVPPTDSPVIPEFVPGNPNMSMGRWLSKIDYMGEMHRWNDIERIYHMQRGLRGLAKSWYDSRKSMNYSWAVWKTLLQEAFPENTDYAVSLHKMLARTKKPTETMATYFYSKIELLQMCKIDGRDAVSCVIDGLSNATLKNSARAGRYETPESLYEEFLSSVTEEVVGSQPTEQREMGLELGKPKKRRCYKCGKGGHVKSECLHDDQSCERVAPAYTSAEYASRVAGKKPEQERKCYTCGQADHFKPTCPQRFNQNSKPPGHVGARYFSAVPEKQAVRKPAQPTNKRKAGAEFGGGPGAVDQQTPNMPTCLKCRKVGHLRFSCPQLSAQKSKFLRQTNAQRPFPVGQQQVVAQPEPPAKKRKTGPEFGEGSSAVDQQMPFPPKCRKCRQVGHIKSKCPQLHSPVKNSNPPAGQANAQQPSTGTGGAVGQPGQPTSVLDKERLKRKCYNCLQVGHVAAGCSQPLKMCQICRRLGHTRAECTRQGTVGSQPPSFFGFAAGPTILDNLVLGFMNSEGAAQAITENVNSEGDAATVAEDMNEGDGEVTTTENMNSGDDAVTITENMYSGDDAVTITENMNSGDDAVTITENMNSEDDAVTFTESIAPENMNSGDGEVTIIENMDSGDDAVTFTENIAPENMDSGDGEVTITENVAPENMISGGAAVATAGEDGSPEVVKTEVE